MGLSSLLLVLALVAAVSMGLAVDAGCMVKCRKLMLDVSKCDARCAIKPGKHFIARREGPPPVAVHHDAPVHHEVPAAAHHVPTPQHEEKHAAPVPDTHQ